MGSITNNSVNTSLTGQTGSGEFVGSISPNFTNPTANNFINGFTSTVTSGSTTTLTVSSNQYQNFTGTSNQTLTLPVVSTLSLGQGFYIVNNSSGVVTVTSSGFNTIQVMQPNTILSVFCIFLSGTDASSWNYQYSTQSPSSGVTALQIQNEDFVYGRSTGSTGTFSVSLSPAVTSYVEGLALRVLMSDTASGNDTLSVNGLSAISIINNSTLSALVGGEFIVDGIADFVYDGGSFQLLNPIVQAGATLQQVQQQSLNYHALAGGTTAYTAVLAPNIGSYVNGLFVVAKVNATNTGASTLNVNNHGAKSIKYTNGSALVGGELLSGMIALLEYDGTNFQLINPYVPYLTLTGGTLTGNLAFNPSTNGLTGTATNDNAGSGTVGEVISSQIVQGSAVSLTAGTPLNVTSISLTAGDWDLYGNIQFLPSGSTAVTVIYGGISTTTNTLPDTSLYGSWSGASAVVPGLIGVTPASQPIKLATTTTIYLVAQASFTVSTLGAFGYLYARRRR